MINEKVSTKIYKVMNDEFLNIINPIINNEEFIKRLKYSHHENRSVYMHCLCVSLYTYKLSKKFGFDYRSATIGALLHDFYLNDWQKEKVKKPLFKQHGFVHAKEACINAKVHFPNLIDEKVENIIKRHMFPLNIIPPFYKESWIVCLVDKYCSLEIFKTPLELYKYIGIKRR